MNRPPVRSRHDSGTTPRKTFSAAVSALAAAMLALNSSDLQAAIGTWRANPADQGVSVTISGDGSSFMVLPSLVEGDAVFIGSTTSPAFGTSNSYYYAVGVGATPVSPVGVAETYARFSQSPSANTFNANGGSLPLTVTKAPRWFTVGNWEGGLVPNGIDDQASVVTNANMTTILLDHDVTLGGLTVDTTTVGTNSMFTPSGATSPIPMPGSNGLSLIASSRTAGPLSTLTLKRSTGTPSITVTGGNSFSLSESKIVGLAPANASARLVVIGDQGLVIDNQNPVAAPIAVNSGAGQTPLVPTFGVGPFRFGFGVDWSNFSGDLTLRQGVFQALAGGSLGNNLSSLPLRSKLILGTGSNTARLEIPGNNGQSIVRGLESTSANSSIINSAIMTTPESGGISLATFEIGSYGLASDSFTYAGNIGDTTNVATVASSPSIRLVKVGPGTQILSGFNNLNATTTNAVLVAVNGGKLSLGTTGAIGVITNGQGAANADSSILVKNGEFEFSGLGVVGARSQSFGGYLIFGSVVPGTGITAAPDLNQASQSNSFSTLTVTADPSQPATLTFGSIKPRNFKSSDSSNLNGTTMLYRGTNLGASPGPGVASIRITAAPTVGGGNPNSVNGSGTLGSFQAPVLKGALADVSPTGRGMGFATYDPTNGVRLLTVSEQNAVGSGSAYDGAPTSDNILLNVSANEAIVGHLSNTLQVNNVSGASRTLTNTGTALNPANGLLFSGADPIVLAGGQLTGTVNDDQEDVVIHSINSSSAGVTIQTSVSNFMPSGTRQGWITYSGTGNFRLEGTHTVGFVGANTATSTFGGIAFNGTGTTTIAAPIINAASLCINQGVVKLDTGATWTNTPRLFLAPEGKFDLNGIGGTATTNRFTDITGSINASGLTLTPLIGEVTNSSPTTVDLRLSTVPNGGTNTPVFVPITGNLNLVVDKWSFNSTTSVFTYGTQSLSAVSTYTGETRILAGVLNVARGGKLPATTVVTLGSTTGNIDINGRDAIGTLSLGDSNTNGAAKQTIAGLYAVGSGASTVINNGSSVSQLTLNISNGVEDVYTGNLGISITAPASPANPTPNGNAANLFGLRKTGPGTFEPAGAVNMYTGGTVIQEGVFRVSADAKLGQIGSLSGVAGSSGAPVAPLSAFPNNIILDGGTLQTTTTADFVLDAKRGIGLGPVSGATGGGGELWVNSGITLTYGGVIASAGNTGTQTLVKNGAGHLSLTGASTFTGVTQVSAGSLGGTGSLASGVTVNSGGAIAPGIGGIGTFTINGALTLDGGAVLNLELAAPGSSDLIQLGGGAVGGSGTTTVNVTGLAGFGVGAYTILSGASAINPANFVVGSVPSGFNGTFSASGGSLILTIAEGSALSAIETWRQAKFGSSANTGQGADSFDADGDGLANLIEYATGTEPLVANTQPAIVGRSGSFLTLTYTRIADATLTYTVEGSADLSTWATVASGNNPSTGVQNVAGQVMVEDTVSVSDAPGRRFLRLKVSR